MSKSTQEDNILTKKGCKITKSRKAVIYVLEKSNVPLPAEGIYLYIKEQSVSVNLSTVYRTLDLLERKGLVNKTIMVDGKSRYELTVDGHRHHLVCISCHRMVPIDACPLEALEKDVGKKTSFDITGHKLELYGVCPECKKND